MQKLWSAVALGVVLAGYPATASADDQGAEKTATEAETIPNRHERPIVEQDGRRMLWALEDDQGNTEWFDMTDSAIDPQRFQFGIGRDVIASIDDPEFISPDDPRLAERGITAETMVLGVEIEGIPRAYPVSLMDMHEVVNDEFGGKPYAVFW